MISIVVRVMMELKLMHWELPSGKAAKKVGILAAANLKQTENFLLLVLKLDGKQDEQCRTLTDNVQSLLALL